jgi:hypothetical protein
MPIIINKSQRIDIPFSTRFEYDAKRTIITGGTKKKNILDTFKNQNTHANNYKHIRNLRNFVFIKNELINYR